MPTRRSYTRRGWPSPPGDPRPTLPSASGPVHGTLRIAKDTSPPRRDAENQRTRCRGISYGRAAVWPAVTPPPPPPPLFTYRWHLARCPAGPGGRGGRTRYVHLPRHRGMAQPPAGAPHLFLPRGPPGPRRPTSRTPRPARLPPRLLYGSPTSAPPRPQRVRHRRQPWPHHMGRPPHGHRHPPLPVPPEGHALSPLPPARPRGPHPLLPA